MILSPFDDFLSLLEPLSRPHRLGVPFGGRKRAADPVKKAARKRQKKARAATRRRKRK
jgi:hypothetical protein